MIKVDSLKQENKKYLVTILNETKSEVFRVSEDLVVQYRLLKGKELSTDTFASLREDARLDDWIQAATIYALRYHKSTLEVIRYLTQKSLTEPDLSKVIAKLQTKRILDDEALLERYFEQEFDLKRNGPQKLLFLLSNKGFDEDSIRRNISKIPYSKIVSNMEILFDKKLPALKNNSIYSAKQKMMAHLVQKGYSLDQVQAFVIEHESRFHEVVNSEEALRREFDKTLRKFNQSSLSHPEINQKIIASLARKGYKISDIKKLLERTYRA